MRPGDLCEVIPRADHVFAALAQAFRDQCRVLEHAHANRHVEAFIDQFDPAIGEVQVHLELWMLALEVVDQWGDEALAEGGR